MTTASHRASPFRLNRVEDVCERLPPLEFRRTISEIFKGNIPDTSVDLTPGTALRIWFKDLLKVLPVEQEQRELIYGELATKVEEFGDHAFEATGGWKFDMGRTDSVPVAFFGLADRRYITMTGLKYMIDLITGERVEGHKMQFLETIQYNLTTLFVQRYLKCKYGGDKDESQDIPGTATV
jgi:hypothetical protein